MRQKPLPRGSRLRSIRERVRACASLCETHSSEYRNSKNSIKTQKGEETTMSSTIMRRNSSKQGLQNLLRWEVLFKTSCNEEFKVWSRLLRCDDVWFSQSVDDIFLWFLFVKTSYSYYLQLKNLLSFVVALGQMFCLNLTSWPHHKPIYF